jgi:PAS domain S-box-containing protein
LNQYHVIILGIIGKSEFKVNTKKPGNPKTTLKKKRSIEANPRNITKISYSKALYDDAPLPYQSLDENGYILAVNTAWLEALGYALKEVIGKSFTEFLPYSQAELFKARFPKFKEIGQVSNIEFTLLKKDGTEILVSFDGKIGYDKKGNFRQTHCIFIDITERKKAERKFLEQQEEILNAHKAIAESEKRYRMLFDSMPDTFLLSEIIYDAENRPVDARILEANAIASKISGKLRDELVGKPIREVISNLPVTLIEDMARVSETGHPMGFKFGSVVNGTIYETYLYSPKNGQCILIGKDITERLRTEEALKNSEQLQAFIYGNVTDIIACLAVEPNEQFRIISVNQALYKITGLTEKQVIGHLFHEVLQEPPSAPDLEYYKMAAREDKTLSWEETRLYPTGEKTGIVTATPVYDFQKEHKYLIVTVHEFSEQKFAEKAIKESHEITEALLNATTDSLALYDKEGVILKGNKAYCKRVGRTLDNLIGHKFDELYSPETAAFRRSKLNQVVLSKKPVNFEDFYNERYLQHNVFPIFNSENEIWAVAIFSKDMTEQRIAEIQIRASEERFRTLAELLPVAIFQTDPNGRCTYVNKIWCDTTGLTLEQTLGDGWVNALPSDDRERIANGWYHVVASGSKWSLEYSYTTPEGKVIWIYSFAAPIFDDNGNVISYLGANTDITEIKQMEEALRKSEQKFRTFADFTYDWEHWIAPDGMIIYISPSCERITGYSPEEFQNNPNLLDSIIHPDDQAFHTRGPKDVSAGEPHNIDYRIITRQGEIRWIAHMCQPVFDENGRFLGRRSSNRDITKRKQVELALIESEEKYRNVVENVNIGVAIIDSAMRIKTANTKLQEWHGKLDNSGILSCYKYYGNPSKKEICENCPVNQTFKDGQVHESVMEAHINDENRLFRTISSPLRDQGGSITAVVKLTEDITEKKIQEKTLLESEKMAATGQMAARIAHEINNPLAGIKNSFMLIKEALVLDHPYFHYAAKIEKEIDRIARIVRQMFDLYRPVQSIPRDFSLKESISDVIEMLQTSCRDKEVTIRLNYPAHISQLCLLEGVIRQVLYNVIQNAIEASSRGGQVLVDVTKLSDCIQISVTDEGDGIPGEIAEKIFEPFFTTKSNILSGGLGLGLYISKSLLESIGGTISFTSRAQAGTTFIINVPLDNKKREV